MNIGQKYDFSEFGRNLVERSKHIFIFDLFWNLSIVTD